MGSRWQSAHHCDKALKYLMDQLSSCHLKTYSDQISTTNTNNYVDPRSHPDIIQRDRNPTQNQTRGTKRKGYNHEIEGYDSQSQPTNPHSQIGTGTLSFPVLEYTGPDFGFDASQLDSEGAPHSLGLETAFETGELFENTGWDAFIQGLQLDSHFSI